MSATLFAILLVTAAGPARAAGISVDPSYLKFGDVEFSGSVRLEKKSGYLLQIGNEGGVDAVYEVSLRSCKESGIKPNGGYAEFPNIDWFIFKSTDVFVPAHSYGYLRYLALAAPMGKSVGKERWQLVLRVVKKSKGSMNLEVLIPVWIETKVEKKSRKTTGEVK